MSKSLTIPTAKALGKRPWMPSDITAMGWWDTSAESTYSADITGAVTQHRDRSGNTYTLNQATGSLQPQTGTRSIGGLNGFDYDGGDLLVRGVAGPYFRNKASAMVFAVAKADVTSGENVLLEATKTGGASRVKAQIQAGFVSIAGRRLDSDSYVEVAGPAADTNPHIYGFIYDWANAEVNFSVDGTLSTAQSYQTAGNTSDTDSPNLGIGARPNGSEAFNGVIGEVVVVESDITTATRQRIEGYLAWKWGFVAALPVGHPYKTNPPMVSVTSPIQLGVRPWTPAYLTKEIWLDMQDNSNVSISTGFFTQIRDRSGNANTFDQASGSLQPSVSSISGLQAARFDGGDEMHTSSNPFGATVSDAFVFLVQKVPAFQNGTAFTLTGSTTGANRWQAHSPWGGSPGTFYFDCGGTSGANRLSVAAGLSVNDIFLMGFYCSNTDGVQEIWKNGVKIASDATGHSISTVGNIYIGSGNGTQFQNTIIGEMIVIKGTITTAIRQYIEGYAAWKWGGVSLLDITHPYKLNPPTV